LIKATFYINTILTIIRSINNLILKNTNSSKFILNNKFLIINNYNKVLNNIVYYYIDYFSIFLHSNNYVKEKFFVRWNIRLKQTNWNFYNKSSKSNLSAFVYFYNTIKYWILALLLFVTIFYYLIHIRHLQINKLLIEYFLILMFVYWLISGFVFFIKKYQYSKFTSVIQRFWKRTYIVFWLIESNVFIIFLYLTINASEEPIYMYDQVKVYKTHLFSWRWFFVKLIPILFIMILGYYLLISNKWSSLSKNSYIYLIVTLTIVYILWLEFYQFFHIINFYGNMIWNFDVDEYIWGLDLETRRTRLVNNYVALCLMAKFWHLVFIFIFWIFFILRSNEIGRVRYTLLAANLQNFIILYIMSWLFMVPWLKYSVRKLYDNTLFWYFLNGRDLGFRIFFNDLKLYIYSFCTFNTNLYQYNVFSFYYWISSSSKTGYLQYRKSVIRDVIISNFN